MKQPSTRATIYDIARRCEASPSTVSAALNGNWKARRISERTVQTIRRVADELGYAVNRQARGLRQSRSGMIGMLLPHHDNRFFSALSQAFSEQARRRDLCPIIVSTDRRADEEIAAVATLAGYSIEALVIAGATAPDALRERCRAVGLAHVFVDQPCRTGRSVVSDNRQGAHWLTDRLIDGLPAGTDGATLHFLGGDAAQHATAKRIAGFRTAVRARLGHAPDPRQITACGYDPEVATHELACLCDRLGGLPEGLLINSVSCFEGAMRYLLTLPPSAFDRCTMGLYDYDPFGAFFPFRLYMVRQNAEGLIGRAFSWLDVGDDGSPGLASVPPDLLEPGEVHVV